MKQKSSKLRKLEKNRFSILTDNLNQCYVCELPYYDIELNEIYEGAKRQASMKHGLVVPLCHTHHVRFHNDRNFALFFKRLGQITFEETHTREEFIEIFKRNYLP